MPRQRVMLCENEPPCTSSVTSAANRFCPIRPAGFCYMSVIFVQSGFLLSDQPSISHLMLLHHSLDLF